MKKSGFTLSEVLVTLVIIGVVAALVIPAVKNNADSEEYRAAAKKAISSLNSAMALHYSLEGLTAQDYDTAEELVQDVFKRRMNNIELNNHEFTVHDCYNSSPDAIFNTADGVLYCVANFYSDMSDEPGSKCDFYNTVPCTLSDGANIWIDVNGYKKPNKVTTSVDKPKDVYQAQIYAQRVLPYGEPTQGILYGKTENSSEFNTENYGSNDYPNAEEENPEQPYEPDYQEPEQPATPDTNPEEDEDAPDENNPYYDKYDPNKWPSWRDFLRWLFRWLMGLL